MKQREIQLLDISEPEGVEVAIATNSVAKEATLWVNIDGICRLRVTRIPTDNGLHVEINGQVVQS